MEAPEGKGRDSARQEGTGGDWDGGKSIQVIQQPQNLQGRSNTGPKRSLGIVSDGGAREDGGGHDW